MWFIILIDFHTWNHLCIPKINPTWSRCIIIFINWIWFLSIMLTIFTSVFRMYVGLRFSCIVFVWLCYQSNPGFTESLPLQSFGNFGKGLVLVFLHMLVELTSKATRSRPFLYWEIFFFFITDSTSLIIVNPMRFSMSFVI